MLQVADVDQEASILFGGTVTAIGLTGMRRPEEPLPNFTVQC